MVMPQPTAFRVLIVDDDVDMREALTEFFRQKGLTVVASRDGREALRAIDAAIDPFQIVLTDLVMPDLSGLDVLKAAKEKFIDVHVVIITGYASLETAIEAVRLGAYDYLTKPFKFSEIEILMKNIGERVGLLQQNRDLIGELRDLHDRLDTLSEGRSKVDRNLRDLEMNIAGNSRKLDQVLQTVNAVQELVVTLNDAVQKAKRGQEPVGGEQPGTTARSIRL